MRRVFPLLLLLSGCASEPQAPPDFYGRCVVQFGYPAGSPQAAGCAERLAEQYEANRTALGAALLGSGAYRNPAPYNVPMPAQPPVLTSPPPMNVRCTNTPNGRICQAY